MNFNHSPFLFGVFFLSCFICKCCKNILFVKSSYLNGSFNCSTVGAVGVQVICEQF